MPRSSVTRSTSEQNRAAITAIIGAYGWTQQQVADQLEADLRTVQRWLSGEVRTPTIARLAVEHLAHRAERAQLMAELDAERRRKPKAT